MPPNPLPFLLYRASLMNEMVPALPSLGQGPFPLQAGLDTQGPNTSITIPQRRVGLWPWSTTSLGASNPSSSPQPQTSKADRQISLLRAHSKPVVPRRYLARIFLFLMKTLFWQSIIISHGCHPDSVEKCQHGINVSLGVLTIATPPALSPVSALPTLLSS